MVLKYFINKVNSTYHFLDFILSFGFILQTLRSHFFILFNYYNLVRLKNVYESKLDIMKGDNYDILGRRWSWICVSWANRINQHNPKNGTENGWIGFDFDENRTEPNTRTCGIVLFEQPWITRFNRKKYHYYCLSVFTMASCCFSINFTASSVCKRRLTLSISQTLKFLLKCVKNLIFLPLPTFYLLCLLNFFPQTSNWLPHSKTMRRGNCFGAPILYFTLTTF